MEVEGTGMAFYIFTVEAVVVVVSVVLTAPL